MCKTNNKQSFKISKDGCHVNAAAAAGGYLAYVV